MDNDVKIRFTQLKKNLKLYGKVAIAFSGGLSSAFLLRTSQSVLGTGNVLAISVLSKAAPEEERLRSQAMIKEWNIKQVFVESEFWKDTIKFNGNRTRECRRELFEKVLKTAKEWGYDLVLDGGTVDDPDGSLQIDEKSTMLVKPLAQAGLTKQHLRDIMKNEGWTIYDIQHNNSLVSRFCHGRSITETDLEKVDRAENLMRNLGFSQVRVRDHGDIARVEIDPEEWERFNDAKLRELIYLGLKKLGYAYSVLDIKGYRPGSMDETQVSR